MKPQAAQQQWVAAIPLQPDPQVRPPEYRVPRGRSGIGALSALEQLLKDSERVRRAKAFYGDLPRRMIDPLI